MSLDIKLAIFDLGGGLVDACDWHRVALNESLKKVCNYEISMDDQINEFNGIPTRVKLQKLTDKGILDAKMHQVIYDLKQSMTVDIIKENAKVRPEKIELIEYLKEQGIIVACFTNSIRETAILMLEKTGVLPLFDMVVTNQDVSFPKPNPEGYLTIMDHYDILNNNTLIFEDSPKGLKAAYDSGAHVMVIEDIENLTVDRVKGIF